MGGGAIAELGVGDEPFLECDEDSVVHSDDTEVITPPKQTRGGRGTPDLQAVSTLPIVVLKNYTTGSKEEVMDVFAKWAAALVERQVRPVPRVI